MEGEVGRKENCDSPPACLSLAWWLTSPRGSACKEESVFDEAKVSFQGNQDWRMEVTPEGVGYSQPAAGKGPKNLWIQALVDKQTSQMR